MDFVNSKKIIKYFRIICALATFALTCWCLVKLIKNEDVSQIEFVNFNDNKDRPYPSLTICFWNPFLNEVLETYGDGINTSTYSRFLQGEIWDDRMLSIDYDLVTVSLENYLHEMGLQYGNFTTRTWSNNFTEMRHLKDAPRYHITNRDGGSKCYTFTLPYVHGIPVISFFAQINNDIFPGKVRSPYPNFDGSDLHGGGFTSFFHLPGQHFRSYFDKKYSWQDRTGKSRNFDMFYTIKNIEVLKRRNKYFIPCSDNWMNDAEMVMHEMMNKVGCKPAHWKIDTTLNICSSSEQMSKFKWPSYHDLESFAPPCLEIAKLQDEYEEMDVVSKSNNLTEEIQQNSWFRITLYFPETCFKQISQAQAYDIESFVGNAGGYLGLFLGYSLVCIPRLVIKALNRRTQRKLKLKEMSENLAKLSSLVIVKDFDRSNTNKATKVLHHSDMQQILLKMYSQQKVLETQVEKIEKKLDEFRFNKC